MKTTCHLHNSGRALLVAVCFITFLLFPYSAGAQREAFTINHGWKFLKEECNKAADADFDDSRWTDIHLPHTWNTDAYTEKDYYKGIGWYRRTLHIPEAWKDKQVFLKIDAASKAATVYLNGKEVGGHAGGYTAFALDLTPYLHTGENRLAIKVDNARQDIAPISADFTFFGGIYRDVWLVVVPKQHLNVATDGSKGVFIHVPQVSHEQGTLSIRSEIKNDAATPASLKLTHIIHHPNGEVLQHIQQKIKLKGGEQKDIIMEGRPVLQPELWSPEHPNLYRVETLLSDAKTQQVLDRSEHYTAFRWFRFDGEQGFFLNGVPYKLRGICRHQDQKPVGVALTDEMHRRDFRLMKDMGANFIRISHYPQDDALLEMCDKLGMLAWEEIPVIDIVPETPGYNEHCEKNLREMIRQHYNHPCIITWGYMNEILLVAQRKYKGEAFKPVLGRTMNLIHRLEKALKEEDPYRVSTMAFHGSNDYNTLGLSEVTDIVGWNLYQGWYGGEFKGFDRFLEEQHRNYPTHPMIVSEYGAGSDKRLHSLQPKALDFSMEYQQIYLEHYLPVMERLPYVCGGTHWNFIDFSSALRDESMPRINNKGLVYNNRTLKDVYYYYKAAWRTDLPVLHIASRDWTHRSAVVKDSIAILPVKVYTNLPEVELYANGQPIGKQRVENCHVTFNVPFSDGETCLSAKGTWNGTPVEDGTTVHFTSVPWKLDERSMAGDMELAVNVGSNCFFTSDDSQLTWIPDQAYTPGSWGYIGGKEQSTQTEIKLTPDGPLYQTMRAGIEGYRFDAPEGYYEIELLFADIFQPKEQAAYLLGRGDDSASTPSGNTFDILLNGEPLEQAACYGAENGYFHAVKRRFVVHNSTDCLELRFRPIEGQTFLSGIKLRKL
ncbi:MAG: DUF4982 domain-containing protein [Bacteroides sp.]|nr:DUF4982 domain-containing protein [Bacteroides sp.]